MLTPKRLLLLLVSCVVLSRCVDYEYVNSRTLEDATPYPFHQANCPRARQSHAIRLLETVETIEHFNTKSIPSLLKFRIKGHQHPWIEHF